MYAGPLFASMNNGSSLPIIDVTHPAFRLTLSDAEIEALVEEYARVMAKEVPPHILEALRQSTFGSALMEASGTFLAGLPTYRMKLGPDNLGSDAGPIDRQIAASPPAVAMRLRLQDMAQLLADGLLDMLSSDPQRPALLVNIGGGVAADSWNALLCIKATCPQILFGRTAQITVLEVDEQGPAFGARAVEVLSAPDAPLASLNLHYSQLRYNWSEPEKLPAILSKLGATRSACVISSEGALFEYGSDSEIIANLDAIHAASSPDTVIAGSVTRADKRHPASNMAVRPRTVGAFSVLAEQASWRLTRIIERPFSYNVALTKAS